jgi:signal transduction histidine kinase
MVPAGRSRRDGGAGLGLAIVRAIAVAHGGTASAASRPGGGAMVRLCLPEVIDRLPKM